MMGKKLWKFVKRAIYGLVGASGVVKVVGLFSQALVKFDSTATVLLTIGGLSWGVVAITGDEREDLVNKILKMFKLL